MASDANKIFVGGIGKSNEDVLKQYFGSFGTVNSVLIPRTNGRGRGFAFVSFADAATVGLVLKEPFHQMDNYAIVEVKPYRARGSNAASASVQAGSGVSAIELGMQQMNVGESSPSIDRIAPTQASTTSGLPQEAERLKIGERVVWISDDGPEAGTVRWIGVLSLSDDEGNQRMQDQEMVGIECDNAVGTGTGRYQETQLFRTRPGYATLIPLCGLIKECDFFGVTASSRANSSPSHRPCAENNSSAEKRSHESSTASVVADTNLDNECQICFERAVDSALIDCGHSVLCYECAKGCQRAHPPLCPICRKDIRDVLRIYRS